MISLSRLWVLSPPLLLLFGTIATYTYSRIAGRNQGRRYTGIIAVFFVFVALALLISAIPAVVAGEIPAAGINPGSIRLALDPLALFLGISGTTLLLLTCLHSLRYFADGAGTGKYYALLLLMTAGILGIGLAQDLFNMYVFFELMSVSAFPLVAFHTGRWGPVRAGIRFAVMSAVGSVTALLGISYLFMYAGTLELARIGPALQAVPLGSVNGLILIAGGLMVAGFGVKAAFVPFHTWLPDAHSEAPSGVSAMLSGIVIQSGLIVLIKALTPLSGMGTRLTIGVVLAVIAAMTMCTGNLLALRQSDLKRMLACSSIAHMGYILMAFAFGIGLFGSGSELGFTGGLYHILGHAFMKGGAFLCAGVLIYAAKTKDIEKLRGMGKVLPSVGIPFALCTLALCGMPPMTGFISEIFICRAGIASGLVGMLFVIIMLANIVLSLAYYIPVVNTILLKNADRHETGILRRVPLPMQAAIAISAMLVLILGIFPQAGLLIVSPAAEFLFGWFFQR